MPGAIPDFGMPGATRVSLDSMVVPGAVPVFAFPGSLHDGRRDAQQGAVRHEKQTHSPVTHSHTQTPTEQGRRGQARQTHEACEPIVQSICR